ncbi:cation acetate symporter [Streptomyces mutabilis]|uniref:sodium/solute symporter n=1 Tax=Streptomyces mutabilis TaxID=67332 RepID=UPI003650A5DE
MERFALAAGGEDLASPVFGFLLVICCAFFFCLIVGVRNADDQTGDFFAANRSLSVGRNTLPMAGDYILVTALLVPVGSVALGGYDGMVMAMCSVVGLVVLYVLAEPLRNTGRFTLGGVLESRAPGRAVRLSGAVVTLAVCAPLTVVQLTVAGDATAYLLDLSGAGAAQVCTVMIGLLMITFAAFGGMRGTTVLAAGKAVLLVAAFAGASVIIVNRFDWDLGALLAAAFEGSGRGEDYHGFAHLFGDSTTGRLDFISVSLTVAIGSGMLPAMIMRISAARDGRTARRSARNAVLGYTLFAGLTIILGLGAGAIVGGQTLAADDPEGNSALFLLSDALADGRDGALFTLISCAVFLTALGGVSGLTLAVSATLAHDVYAKARRRHRGGDEREVRVARWAVLAFGVASVVLAVLLHGWSILFLATYAIAVASSVILPAVVYSLFWKRFHRTGLLWMVYGGLACCTVLQLSSPTVSGDPTALFADQDFQWFPLRHIGIVALPVTLLLGWIGSRVGRRASAETGGDAKAEARILAGLDTV